MTRPSCSAAGFWRSPFSAAIAMLGVILPGSLLGDRARSRAAALDRRALVRHLPVALAGAGARADGGAAVAGCRVDRLARGCRHGRDHCRRGRPVVPVARAADPATGAPSVAGGHVASGRASRRARRVGVGARSGSDRGRSARRHWPSCAPPRPGRPRETSRRAPCCSRRRSSCRRHPVELPAAISTRWATPSCWPPPPSCARTTPA